MDGVAVAVPMFSRVGKLQSLLKSVDETAIQQVYVADNGRMTNKKHQLYSKNYSFNLTVFDLEYDSGIGNCRRVLSQRPTERILLFLDPDMTLPQNHNLLIDQLQARSELGGVSGLLLEGDRIYTTASDIKEENGIIHRGNWAEKEFDLVANRRFAEFDFIPQVGAFRRECFDDYTWDDFYRTQREHIDFFVGHHKQTMWTFGICFQVLFPHFPGGSKDYQTHRQSKIKRNESHRYFCEKWDCDDVRVDGGTWLDTYPYYTDPSHWQRLKQKCQDETLLETARAISNFFRRRVTGH